MKVRLQTLRLKNVYFLNESLQYTSSILRLLYYQNTSLIIDSILDIVDRHYFHIFQEVNLRTLFYLLYLFIIIIILRVVQAVRQPIWLYCLYF